MSVYTKNVNDDIPGSLTEELLSEATDLLTARGPGAIYPAVRYVVRRSTLRPVRAEYRLPSGKVATIVEFENWSAGGRPYASRLLVRDALHGGATTAVDVLEVEERPVPEELFDLGDQSARSRLEMAPRSPSP